MTCRVDGEKPLGLMAVSPIDGGREVRGLIRGESLIDDRHCRDERNLGGGVERFHRHVCRDDDGGHGIARYLEPRRVADADSERESSADLGLKGQYDIESPECIGVRDDRGIVGFAVDRQRGCEIRGRDEGIRVGEGPDAAGEGLSLLGLEVVGNE